jgi:hypothetical protein
VSSLKLSALFAITAFYVASLIPISCSALTSFIEHLDRWHMDNLSSQCASCNARHEYDAEPYRRWILKRLGQNGLSELAELANSSHKFTIIELDELLKGFKAILAELKSGD